MNKSQSLARRIVISLVMMTTLVSLAFSVAIVFAILFVEEQLLSSQMDRELMQVISNPEILALLNEKYEVIFYRASAEGLPQWVAALEPGFAEAFSGSDSYHAWVKDIAGERYYLLSNQSDFEKSERLLLLGVVLGFLLSIVLSWVLAKSLVLRVITPVIQLSLQVRDREDPNSILPPLVDNYALDEVGLLAKSFDDLLLRYRETLQREQLFSADVSHELRTPLMIISTTCELLLSDHQLNQIQEQRVAKIAEACNDIRELSDTFLLLLRDQFSKGHVLPMLSVQELSVAVEKKWRPKIEARAIDFRVSTNANTTSILPAGPINILVDNLLRNALNNTVSGSIELTLSPTKMSVTDTGAGLSEGHKSIIFKPFTKSPDNNAALGYGLGLSIMQRICSALGWSIDYVHREAGGTVFTVIFCDQ